MPFVYILECRDGTYYTGSAVDVQSRLSVHNQGKGAKYTRGRLPVQLQYQEAVADFSLALKREREIKKLTRKQKQKLIEMNSYSDIEVISEIKSKKKLKKENNKIGHKNTRKH